MNPNKPLMFIISPNQFPKKRKQDSPTQMFGLQMNFFFTTKSLVAKDLHIHAKI